MKPILAAAALAACLFAATPAAAAAPGLPSTNVAWLPADADIARAFAPARAEKKPGLLSWGADGKQAATIERLRTQRDGMCPKVDAGDERAACNALLKPTAKKAA